VKKPNSPYLIDILYDPNEPDIITQIIDKSKPTHMKLTRAITATEEITLPAYFQNETGTQHVAILAPDHMLDVKTYGVGRCIIAVHPVPDGFTLNGLLRLQESQFWYAVNPLIDSIRETATEHLTAEPIPFTVHDKVDNANVQIHDTL
jgi:hypothetical protein